ncbi:MAG: hypothetical protein OEZ33_01640 [Gammaproteobacteria bacterium]|nr:hypothetical protein [Gammaproteobacteria bacterium]MDH5776886.1 hypothetical protein [Gammaproteobacteria bacterium]
MNDRVRVTWDDLKFGEELPWNVYDQNDKLLLSAGHTISNTETMDNLRQYVLYRNILEREHGKQNKQKTINVFVEIDDYIDRLAAIFEDIECSRARCLEKIERLARNILDICRNEPEATLALLRTENTYPYSLFYAIQQAIMCGMMAIQENMYPDEEIEIVSAALTANVGMQKIQNKLQKQMRLPTEDEQYILDHYPAKSHEMLAKTSVENNHWLNIVRDHKSCLDGRISLDQAGPGTIMLAIANIYTRTLDLAAIDMPWSESEALDKFFADTPFENGHYARLILEIMTVYPPGIFLTLANDETAIVIKRGKYNKKIPSVRSVAGEKGKRYVNPLFRDVSADGYMIHDYAEYDYRSSLNYSRLWDFV